MKLPSRFALPARGSASRRPAAMVLILGAMAALQLALPPSPPPATAAMVTGGRIVPAIADPAPVAVPRLAALPFAPNPGQADQSPADPLGGAVIAGTVRLGGARYALIQDADGAIRRAGIGTQIGGWRIVALTDTGARLARGAETLAAAYGQHPATAPSGASDASQENTE